MDERVIRRVPGAGAMLPIALSRLHRGTLDPTVVRRGSVWWRATRTPVGPAVASYEMVGGDVEVVSSGPGAEWLAEHAPRLFGAEDDPVGFVPRHPLLTEVWRRHPWLRVGASDAVLEVLAPSILEQRVTGAEAYSSFAGLTRRFGESVPRVWRSPPLVLPLTAEQWRAIPSWEFLRAGVESVRVRALVGAAGRNVERVLSVSDPDKALRSLSGVGVWTSAQVRQVALGDPDAWSEGDYHVPRGIAYALTGDESTDAGEVLAEWAGHRYRVEQLVALSGVRVARRGPRRALPTHLPGRSARRV